MNKFGLTLTAEMPILYANLINSGGFVPKVFTLVNEDGDQYVFYLDKLDLDRESEGEFYRYILKEHKAVAYARGFLTVLETGQQQIYIAIIEKDNPNGIQLVATIERDESGAISNIGQYRKDFGAREKIFHGWWFDEKESSGESTQRFQALWDSIKANAMHRQMVDFVNG